MRSAPVQGPTALSRRRLITLAGGGALAVAVGAVVSACGSASPDNTSTSISGGTAATSGGTTPTFKAVDGGALGNITAAGVATLNGTGSDISNGGDDFVYAYQTWTAGDGDWRCQIASVEAGSADVNPWMKSGIMVSDSTDPMAGMFLICATGGHGVIIDSRQPGDTASTNVTQQDSTNTSDGGTIDAASQTYPVWVRVTRKGTTFQGYTSTDGKTWNPFGTTVDLTLSATLVGLAALSHVAGSTDVAVFKDISGFVPTTITQVGTA